MTNPYNRDEIKSDKDFQIVLLRRQIFYD
jgi:hypothetical protein